MEATADFDLHAKFWKKIIKAQSEQISSGGYLTTKFQEVIFQPALELISFEVRKLTEELSNQSQMDTIQIALVSVALVGTIVIAAYYFHKSKILQKNIVLK